MQREDLISRVTVVRRVTPTTREYSDAHVQWDMKCVWSAQAVRLYNVAGAAGTGRQGGPGSAAFGERLLVASTRSSTTAGLSAASRTEHPTRLCGLSPKPPDPEVSRQSFEVD